LGVAAVAAFMFTARLRILALATFNVLWTAGVNQLNLNPLVALTSVGFRHSKLKRLFPKISTSHRGPTEAQHSRVSQRPEVKWRPPAQYPEIEYYQERTANAISN